MKFTSSTTLTEQEIETTAQTLAEYTSHLQTVVKNGGYEEDEGSLNLPSDVEIIKNITDLAQKLCTKKLKYVIDIAIGGSLLGARAMYDAVFGSFDTLEANRFPKIIFCETNNSEFLYKFSALMKTVKDPEEVIINIISKSGTTTETVANAEIVLQSLTHIAPQLKDRTVVTTDEKSALHQAATTLGAHTLPHPPVGGRYSIFSYVGLFPLACAGIDIQSLCKGAVAVRDRCVTTKVKGNPALASAIILFLHYQKHKMNINDNFFFHSELESVGKWYRQLMGESIGKDGKGITPTVSIGSTDLHSLGQLYYGGPKDKISTIVSSKKTSHNVTLPEKLQLQGLVKHIEGKKASDVMGAIVEGVKISYKNQSLPFMYVELDDLSERSLGEFLQFKMIEMMYLAKLLGVNAFDQPHVELYKIEMRKVLSSN